MSNLLLLVYEKSSIMVNNKEPPVSACQNDANAKYVSIMVTQIHVHVVANG